MEIIAILLLIGASMIISANDQATYVPQEEQNKTVETVEAYHHGEKTKFLDSYDIMTINAQEWLQKYSDNFWKDDKQRKMQDNWKGHYIKLTGEISKIRYDYINGCKISFRQKNVNNVTEGTCIIICSVYDQKDIDNVLKYKKGDTITIVGYAQWIIGPELIDCHIR